MLFTVLFLALLLKLFIWAVSIVGALIIIVGIAVSSAIDSRNQKGSQQKDNQDDIDDKDRAEARSFFIALGRVVRPLGPSLSRHFTVIMLIMV